MSSPASLQLASSRRSDAGRAPLLGYDQPALQGWRVGVADLISLGALLLSGLGVTSAGVFALFKIGKALGASEARVAECLERHSSTLEDHEARLREGGL